MQKITIFNHEALFEIKSDKIIFLKVPKTGLCISERANSSSFLDIEFAKNKLKSRAANLLKSWNDD